MSGLPLWHVAIYAVGAHPNGGTIPITGETGPDGIANINTDFILIAWTATKGGYIKVTSFNPPMNPQPVMMQPIVTVNNTYQFWVYGKDDAKLFGATLTATDNQGNQITGITSAPEAMAQIVSGTQTLTQVIIMFNGYVTKTITSFGPFQSPYGISYNEVHMDPVDTAPPPTPPGDNIYQFWVYGNPNNAKLIGATLVVTNNSGVQGVVHTEAPESLATVNAKVGSLVSVVVSMNGYNTKTITSFNPFTPPYNVSYNEVKLDPASVPPTAPSLYQFWVFGKNNERVIGALVKVTAQDGTSDEKSTAAPEGLATIDIGGKMAVLVHIVATGYNLYSSTTFNPPSGDYNISYNEVHLVEFHPGGGGVPSKYLPYLIGGVALIIVLGYMVSKKRRGR